MSDALAIHDAYKRGDPAALRAAPGDPPDFPNCRGPQGGGEIVLEYAIYHGPPAFVRALLAHGADANYGDHAGFPSLIAALCRAGEDRYEVIKLLLSRGADIQQRGINDYTPLHYAAATDDAKAVVLLLAHGADPAARTRIDAGNTPLEEAEMLGHRATARVLREALQG